jgi:hypothetical protein
MFRTISYDTNLTDEKKRNTFLIFHIFGTFFFIVFLISYQPKLFEITEKKCLEKLELCFLLK